MDISVQKKLLRKKYIQQRLSLSPAQWRSNSDKICQNILDSEIFRQAKVVLSYFSFKQEPDLSLLHQQDKVIWGFPRCEGNNLVWHQWQWGNELDTGKYNILEPLADSPLIDITLVDLILVPSVLLDRTGYRLGYGGGYYDRMLASFPCQNTMGIVFDFAYIPHLPRESWDKPLKYICTENNLSQSLEIT
ncbi:5-formyltetrahydrofolate cyclo-ligase [Geminocystis sp. CENA526]|uniref:5-formyltetrahydrofolate cyclo-ligase n=1 Tax=Geminocystis sp. CENA526 TaxID=1355871 RepID=UPI003D6FE30D